MAREEKHPHVRGEDSPKMKMQAIKGETPPRAWGRPEVTTEDISGVGNTPTCVGKTPTKRVYPNEEQKHPHVRGEDARFKDSYAAELETPPRAWGRH